MVSGSGDGSLQLWGVAHGDALSSSIDGHAGGVTGIAYGGDGKRIFSAGNDGALRVWDAATLKMVARFEGAHTGPITAVALDRRSGRFATASLDNTLRIWQRPAEPRRFGNVNRAPIDDIRAVAFDGQGHPVVVGARVQTALESPVEMARSPGGTRRVVHNPDGTLTLWDVDAKRAIVKLVAAVGDGDTAVRDVVFSPDGAHLMSLDRPDRILRWDATSGRALPPLITGNVNTTSVAIARDGRTLATGSGDGSVRIWDLATRGLASPPLRGSGQPVAALALSPDGRRVAMASPDGALYVWERASDRAMLGPLRGHQAAVSSLAFSPDGLRIVSGGGAPFATPHEQPRLDYTLRLWDATSGRAIGSPMSGHRSTVADLAFSPDGKRIASASHDGDLRIWDVFDGWRDALCAKLPRNPTAAEWRDWASPDIAYTCPCPDLARSDPLSPGTCRADSGS